MGVFLHLYLFPLKSEVNFFTFVIIIFQKVFEHIGTDAINFDQFCKALEALKQHATGQ